MPRVKRGVTARARHKKVLALAKGYRGRRKNVFRIAKQAVMRAGQYAYRDRRTKKRVFRQLWIARINAASRGLKVIIAGAGGAAHLPGMAAAFTSLPVLGVPVQSKALKGLDSLLSIVQMPKGVAVGTLAIGDAGAANAGLLAAQILATSDAALMTKIDQFRKDQTDSVLSQPNPAQDA